MREGTLLLDKYTRVLLTIIAVLLTVIAIELAQQGSPSLPTAQAQIPDTALQRKLVVDELRTSNRHLSAILEHLRSKSVKVEMKETDTRKGNPAGSRKKSGS